ncbi:MAG: metallophosphoesterase [Gemmatimonadetes bacterium]|nr:metallophosphoesterase [Gemmatimonadota bacterium]
MSRHAVAVAGLPSGLDGLTILHLTDLHLYAGLHSAARRVMALAAELAPDVTVVTGDLVESTLQLRELTPWLAACRGRLATVVTLGNWEHQVGVTPDAMERTAAAAGATLLYNRSLVVERGGARLTLVGLDDARSGAPDPEGALRDTAPGSPQVWVFHAPGYADVLRSRGLPRPAFALAGHTHGGQIRPPLLPPITPPASGRFVAGWYRDTFAPLYVSRGIGTSGIRARFRCPPEIGVFTVHRS